MINVGLGSCLMDRRQELATKFLANTDWAGISLVPLAGDASARRYFRLQKGGLSAVLMDAPPVDGQDISPFLEVGEFLTTQGLCPPKVLASDRVNGFILLEDLGDAVFAKVIQADPTTERMLYEAATDVLIALDQQAAPSFVPQFNASVMAEHVAPFFEWYLGDTDLLDRFQDELETVLSGLNIGFDTVLLRDFHAENLIWLPNRAGLHRVGLLDFQDAMTGPPSYDLVSLLQDARRDVSAIVVSSMIDRFIKGTGRNEAQVRQAFAVVGVQRNLRILGVFARLAQLHGKPRYLEFVPRVWGHVQSCLTHPSLAKLAKMLEGKLPEPSPDFLRRLAKPCE